MRNPRYIPKSGSLVEVTTRTLQGRLLMVPGPTLNQAILGVLGRAQRLYPIQIHAYCFLSSHYHLLATADDALQLSQFVGYLNSNLAREIAHLTGWTDKIWSRRYEAIQVSDEIEAQVDRMKYLLANGTKEGLVEHPQDWPGVHCADLLLRGGDQAEGLWYNRTRQYALHRTRKAYTEDDYTHTETVQLTPLPCWKHLTPEDYRRQIQGLVELIVSEARAERALTGKAVLGPDALRQQKPGTRPEKLKKSPAPDFHAFKKSARKALYESFSLFLAAYRVASEKLRSGERTASFPMGCFPPGLPFVGAAV